MLPSLTPSTSFRGSRPTLTGPGQPPSGELRLGYGRSFAPSAAARYPTGSFLYVPPGVIHFDGADEDTILLGTAIGPWSTDYHQP